MYWVDFMGKNLHPLNNWGHTNEGETPIKKEEINEENSSKLHKCKICHYVCRTSNNLWYHVRSVHERMKCPICDRYFATKQSVAQHIIKSHSEDTFESKQQGI